MTRLENLSDLDPITLAMVADFLERTNPEMKPEYQKLPDELYRLQLAHNEGKQSVTKTFRFAAERAKEAV